MDVPINVITFPVGHRMSYEAICCGLMILSGTRMPYELQVPELYGSFGGPWRLRDFVPTGLARLRVTVATHTDYREKTFVAFATREGFSNHPWYTIVEAWRDG